MSKRDRAVQIVPNIKTESPITDDRDGVGIPALELPPEPETDDGDHKAEASITVFEELRPISAEDALVTLRQTYDQLCVDHAELTSARDALAEQHAMLTAQHTELVAQHAAQQTVLATSTVWEVSWSAGRAWVVARSIEDALSKARARQPGVVPTGVKAAGVELVI